MTKKEFIDLIKRRLASGNLSPDQEGSYHDNEIAHFIERGMDRIFYQAGNAKELDKYSKAYKNIDVEYDSDLDLYYSVLPESIVQIDGVQGIRSVSLMKDQSFSFVHVTQQSMRAFLRLDSGRIGKRPWMFYDGGRLYYGRMKKDIKKVLMRLVIPFTRFEDDDEVFVPAGMSDTIIQFVLQIMTGQINEDQLSDNRRQA